MSRLNLIVESLLKDIIEAQHAANCHAASLARQYGKRGRACGFPLPSAQIGSLEFDLKYAVTGTSGVEEKQVADTEQWSLFRQELEERVPSFAIRSIVMVSGAFQPSGRRSEKRLLKPAGQGGTVEKEFLLLPREENFRSRFRS